MGRWEEQREGKLWLTCIVRERNLFSKKKRARSCVGREVGVNLEENGDEYEHNTLYENLIELIKIL